MGEYDSAQETQKHIDAVRLLLNEFVSMLFVRGAVHDRSKLREPEKSVFDEWTPKLSGVTYGSQEYRDMLAQMKPAIDHHQSNNRHHPEYGDNGIEWRSVIGYEGYYDVSNFGDVRSVSRTVSRDTTGDYWKVGAILKASVTPKGYLRIQLTKDCSSRSYMVHRLVAEVFIENKENKPEVNHVDGNKKNNHVVNLEWVTSSENLQHAYETQLKDPAVKYVVYCPEVDIATLGMCQMERKLKALGYHGASANGIWQAMDRQGKHVGLTFEGTLLSEYRRSQIQGMNLIDVAEMICDWLAATKRHADGDIMRSIEINQKRFGYSDELKQILINTVNVLKQGASS